MNQIISNCGIHHVALLVADREKSLRFYEALGFTHKATWGEGRNQITMLDSGNGTILEMFAKGGDEYSANGKYNHLAFGTDDVEGAYCAALNAGATPKTRPTVMDIPSVPAPMKLQVAFVKGPDGEEIEFCKFL